MPPSAHIVGRLPPSALLDLRRLATLAEVARRGSFASAAEAMCLTPSAVSQQMSALGRDMGVVLFERTPQGMRLTESAEALVAHAEAVFARLGEAQGELEAIAGGVGGRLRFGSFPTATTAFGARAMEAFRNRHPGVELRFADGEPYESVARLKERELDLAVLFDFDHWTAATDYDGRAVCDDRDIECVELFDDPFHVVVPREHPLAAAACAPAVRPRRPAHRGQPVGVLAVGPGPAPALLGSAARAGVRVLLSHRRLQRAAGDRRHRARHHTGPRARADHGPPGRRRAAAGRRTGPPRGPRHAGGRRAVGGHAGDGERGAGAHRWAGAGLRRLPRWSPAGRSARLALRRRNPKS
ncbi:MAG: LysR family transcriptional regulator [Thermoleophilaceae bacterium]